MNTDERIYLGDAVYIGFDGTQFVLTTEYGDAKPTNIIYLDTGVAFRLVGAILNHYDVTDVAIESDAS